MKLQIGVKLLIQNTEGDYLFLRRAHAMADETHPHWEIPGGRIEPEEALREGLTRELKEETGLALSEEPELIAAQDIFVPKAAIHVVRLTYRLHTKSNLATPVLSDEHQDATWMSLHAALASDQLDPYLRKVLSRLAE